MSNKNPVVMYDSPEAASVKTVTGWVSRCGRFFGDNEHLARWVGSTHIKCEKNNNHPAYEINSYCRDCYDEGRQKKFEQMPSKAWDGDSPIALFDCDNFFFSKTDLFDYLVDNDIHISNAQLVHCRPTYPREINPTEYYEDDLPDGAEVDAELKAAFDALNEVIKKQGPLCWYQDDVKVELSPAQIQEFDRDLQAALKFNDDQQA